MNDSADWTSQGLSPALWWDQALRSADGAVLACPQCGEQHLHLEKIRYATPADGTYTPTIGVSIDGPHVATHGEDDHEAPRLHNGTNRGPMLAIGYWCENGCRGRIELRAQKATSTSACTKSRSACPTSSPLPSTTRTRRPTPALSTLTRPSRPSEPPPRRARRRALEPGPPVAAVWLLTPSPEPARAGGQVATGSGTTPQITGVHCGRHSKGWLQECVPASPPPTPARGRAAPEFPCARPESTRTGPDTNNPRVSTCTTGVATDNVLPVSL